MKMRVCVLPEDKEVQSRLENGPFIDLGIFFCVIKKIVLLLEVKRG